MINTHSDKGKISPATEFYKRQQTEKEEWKACRSVELYQSLQFYRTLTVVYDIPKT
jgi:hypothetical protein